MNCLSFLLPLLPSPPFSPSPPLSPFLSPSPSGSIMSECPHAVCAVAFDLVQRLSPIVRQLDYALDWTELEAGRALYKYVCVYVCVCA